MEITLDLSKKIGKIKDMNATGQAPLGGGIGFDAYKNFHLLSDVCVPYVRLHDVGGAYGGFRYVDVPNIFRDFEADENDPASYDFAFTDVYITELVKNGLKPYYRLGVTIENHAEIRSYRIDPPTDYEKWARVCAHIVMHYNEGWANGFHYGIEYWEIWNEPDDGERVSQMWNGTPEDYYRLYDVASKHLKARFPHIKVGGYAAIGFQALTDTPEQLEANPRHAYQMRFFHGFMEYVREHGSPLDFFSWHCYGTVEPLLIHGKWVREQLDAYGFKNTESHINEWNPPPRTARDRSEHAAKVAAIMLGAQNVGIDMLMIYDARYDATLYSAFFTPGVRLYPSHTYYAFAAFAALYRLGTQVSLTCDTDGVYAVAASNGEKHALMISNVSEETKELHITGADLSNARWHLIDDARRLSWSPALTSIEHNTVVLIEF